MAWVPFVDISESQGTVRAPVMHAAGVRHCVVRAHSGGRRDRRIDEYVPALRAAGIGVPMLYGFCNPKAALSAAQQGDALGVICQQYGVRTGMADVEGYDREPGPNPVLTGGPFWRWLTEYIDALEQRMQHRAVIYTGAWFWDGRAGGSGLFAGHDLVLSGYPGMNRAGDYDALPRGVPPERWADVAFANDRNGPDLPRGFAAWVAWQFSAGGNGQGPVYGCTSADLDLNIVDSAALARWYGGPEHVPGGIPTEEDDMPFSEEELRRIVREEALNVVTDVMRSDEYGAIIDGHVQGQVIGVLRSGEARTIFHEAVAGASGPPEGPTGEPA